MSKILPVSEKMHAKTGFVILGKQTDISVIYGRHFENCRQVLRCIYYTFVSMAVCQNETLILAYLVIKITLG